MFTDVRRACRYLWGNPRFTIVAVLSLAFGISAASAIFTFVYSVQLAPLPFRDSDRLIVVQETDAGRPVSGSPQRYHDWLRAPSIERVAAYYGEDYSVLLGAIPERISGLRTFGDPLETLNVQPSRGRGFTAAEKRGAGPRVAVITDSLWRERFSGDPSAIGRKISLNGEPCEIVGILPPGARLDEAEIFAPEPNQNLPRSARFLVQVARLRPGAMLVSARSEIKTVASQLRREFPATDATVDASPVGFRDYLGASVRMPLLLLLGAVGFVLLMACINTAGLSLSRIAGRRREIAIRRALGASRMRIAGMVLIESGILAGAGGLLGLFAAGWGIDLLRVFFPPGMPRLNEVRMNGAVIAFAFALTAAATIIAGLLPAWHSASDEVNHGLGQGGRSTSRTHRTQAFLVASQLALSVMLLIAGGLLFRTVWSLEHRPLGFAPQRMLTFRLSLPWQMADQKVATIYERVLERLRSIPGVRDAALADRLPLGGPTQSSEPDVEGKTPRETAGLELNQRVVSPNFHRIMRVPLLAGRYLEDSDVAQRRTVLNQSAAQELFPAGDSIGKRIGLRWNGASSKRFEIVGIVADLPQYARDQRGAPAMYIPFQQGFWPLATFVVQSSAPPSLIAGEVRRAVAEIDSDRPLEDVRPLDAYLSSRTRTERAQAWLAGIFGVAAMLLAAMGAYGLAARRAADGRRDMAIRIALGATPGTILGSALRSTIGLAAAGAIGGIALGAWVARSFRAMLYGVEPVDPGTYALAAAVLVAVAVIAALRPAISIARLDPIVVLRGE
jgi:putative ABC transport system permease protein